jgi:hypothetical protein
LAANLYPIWAVQLTSAHSCICVRASTKGQCQPSGQLQLCLLLSIGLTCVCLRSCPFNLCPYLLALAASTCEFGLNNFSIPCGSRFYVQLIKFRQCLQTVTFTLSRQRSADNKALLTTVCVKPSTQFLSSSLICLLFAEAYYSPHFDSVFLFARNCIFWRLIQLFWHCMFGRTRPNTFYNSQLVFPKRPGFGRP